MVSEMVSGVWEGSETSSTGRLIRRLIPGGGVEVERTRATQEKRSGAEDWAESEAVTQPQADPVRYGPAVKSPARSWQQAQGDCGYIGAPSSTAVPEEVQAEAERHLVADCG